MDLQDYRAQINEIDDALVSLFQKRMEVAGSIAAYKKENSLPILDAAREREKLAEVWEKSSEDFAPYTGALYSLIFELSRAHQALTVNGESDLQKTISAAIDEKTNCEFPQNAFVACQGVEGAFSQLAASRMFQKANLMYFDTFEGVFSAIEKGLCRYGVLPIENSTAGSVQKVYDLMLKHRFYIVKSTRIKIEHALLAPAGTSLSDVREIFTHEQAILQCRDFLESLGKDVKVTACENTAAAAKMVAESGRRDAAAIGSRQCAALYGLSTLCPSIQDSENNYTRFICISRDLEIYPGADKTSLSMVLPHTPGALYKVLARFYTLGINLIKLESRPLPSRNFEFMFYFDLETSVYSEAFVRLVCALESLSEEFRYLGSYSEIV